MQTLRAQRPLVLASLLVVAGATWRLAPAARVQAQGPVVRHRMTRLTNTIYRADNPGTAGLNSTSWVFVNDDDVLVTDSEGSLDAARSLLAGIATITDKPVRYLVDTHFHIDHAYGNAALPSTVQIIGSDFTHRMLVSTEAREGVTFKNFGVDPYPARLDNIRKQLAAETDPGRKQALEQQLAQQTASYEFYRSDFPLKAPNLSVKEEMSIWSGAKEFRIMYLGRAHTAGDVVVYVPSEKVVANGDILFKATVGWQGDAFPNEHPDTIEALRKIDAELLLPGHGDPIQGRGEIDRVIGNMQNYLREEWRQVSAAKQAGLTPEDALAKADFTRFRDFYGNGATPSLAAVRRIYNIIDNKVIR